MTSNSSLQRTQLVGSRVRRREDPALITGRGTYTADIFLEGMAYLAFVRSHHAHARILAVDTRAAQALEGVVTVQTAADINPRLSGTVPGGDPGDDALTSEGKAPTRAFLATDKARFSGEPVAVVVADSPAAALDAAEKVVVDYEPLAAVIDPEAALAAGAPVLHEQWDSNLAFHWGPKGTDVTGVFAAAANTVELRVENQRIIPSTMEPRAVVATHDAGSGVTTVWLQSQTPHEAREVIASRLGVDEERVRVIVPEVGGGFGARVPVYAEEIIVAHLAREMGLPVKWVATRTEDYLSTNHGRGQIDLVRLAAGADGVIQGAELHITYDCGAYCSAIAPNIPRLTIDMMCGSYAIPHIQAEVKAVFTNKHPAEPYRGTGRAEAGFAIERAMDVLAAEMGIDPAELRRRNYIRPVEFPYTTPTGLRYDSGEYARSLDKALTLTRYQELRKEQAARRRAGARRLLGIGLASYVEICGFGPWEMGSVTVDADARVTIVAGTSSTGQGHATTWSQIAADTLQIPPVDITVHMGDTARVPRGVGTFGSRSTVVAGSTILNNARVVRDKGRRIAAHLLEAAAEDVRLADGQFHVVGVPSRAVSWAAVAAAAHDDELPPDLEGELSSDEDFSPENAVYPFGTQVVVVEVDAETGAVEIIRYVSVDDCGVVVNPLLVEGQVHGGIAQGVGQALLEAARYDQWGNLVSGCLLDYALPRADNLPRLEAHRTETPSPLNPLGAKGIGEAATIGAAPAVVNAVVDALAHLGVRHVDMPLTGERVWGVIRSSRQAPDARVDAPG